MFRNCFKSYREIEKGDKPVFNLNSLSPFCSPALKFSLRKNLRYLLKRKRPTGQLWQFSTLEKSTNLHFIERAKINISRVIRQARYLAE
jgi:hypothetical protein